MLELGRYQTRIGRIVELIGVETRTKTNLNSTTKQVRIFRGKLFQANGRDVESQHEWEENFRPEPPPPGWAMGCFLQQSSVEGVPHNFDLIIRVA